MRTLAEQALAPGQAPGLAPARLVVITTNLAGTEFVLDRPSLVIGRTPENDIVLNHKSISRHHAKVIRDGDKYIVVDLESANGVRVNGSEFERVELKSGDTLELGHVRLRFTSGADYVDFDIGEAGRSRRRLVFGAAGGAVVVAGFALAFAMRGGEVAPPEPVKAPVATAPVSAGSPDPARPPCRRWRRPASGPSGSPEGLIAQAKAAKAKENWDGALEAVKGALDLAPLSQEAVTLREAIEGEQEASQRFAKIKEAAKANNHEEVLNLFGGIAESSIYRPRALSLRRTAQKQVITLRLAEANKFATRGECSQAKAEADRVLALEPDHDGARSTIERCERVVAKQTEKREREEREAVAKENAAKEAAIREAAAKEAREAREVAAREALALKEAAAKEAKAAKDVAAKEAAARAQAAREQAVKDAAARAAAREMPHVRPPRVRRVARASREQAAREQAVKDAAAKAAKDQAAREAAAAKAAKELAAREAAAAKAAREKAAREEAAREQAARLATREQAAREQAAKDAATKAAKERRRASRPRPGNRPARPPRRPSQSPSPQRRPPGLPRPRRLGSSPSRPRPDPPPRPPPESGGDPEALYQDAQQAWLRGQYMLAIDSARRALKARPSMTKAYQIIAACSCSLKQASDAVKAYERLDDNQKKLVKSLCQKAGIELELIRPSARSAASDVYFRRFTGGARAP